MNAPARGTILLVDDDPSSVRVLTALLSEVGYGVVSSSDVDQALRILKVADPDAIISDVKLPGRDGLSLLVHCHEHYPDIPVILLTAYGTVQSAVDAVTQGAFYYFIKPPDYAHLRNVLAIAVERRRLRREVARLRNEKESGKGGARLIFASPPMQKLYQTIEAVKDSQSSILICGETGSGKEMVARALHMGSVRAGRSFVAVNCAAVPRNLIESELFGYERGAFTGAVTRRIGKFVEASGGTLFLDEVAELDLSVQAKLLRVLQEREVHPLGSNQTIHVDFRLICATNRDLAQEVASGAFREDIYYRINVVQIQMPPLRERRADIPLLISDFIQEFCVRENKTVTISDEALEVLQNYDWPGNVRQLRNAIERAVVLGRAGRILVRHLPPEIAGVVREQEAPRMRTLRLCDLERDAIVEALRQCEGNKSDSAKVLGISRKTLYKKIQDYDIKEN
ncbi:MAG TPA: sigma-54 dependent transcriptional regulator [Dissulfurispiraceae bacterium]|nr:sigma-54 dependent transcriptional regulator [Dissulfurispiraceae bacterium]